LEEMTVSDVEEGDGVSRLCAYLDHLIWRYTLLLYLILSVVIWPVLFWHPWFADRFPLVGLVVQGLAPAIILVILAIIVSMACCVARFLRGVSGRASPPGGKRPPDGEGGRDPVRERGESSGS
jgi:hypothetical protein